MQTVAAFNYKQSLQMAVQCHATRHVTVNGVRLRDLPSDLAQEAHVALDQAYAASVYKVVK